MQLTQTARCIYAPKEQDSLNQPGLCLPSYLALQNAGPSLTTRSNQAKLVTKFVNRRHQGDFLAINKWK